MTDNSAPLCFMHVPKSAGTSLHVALEAALPPGSIAPRRADTSTFCDFDAFDQLDEPARALVAVTDAEVEELAQYRVVSGHFSLPTLLRVAPPENVATILREPRSRVLSAFLFLRLSGVVEFWGPYGRDVLEGAARSLEDCLSDPRYARAIDNQVCRLVLDGDPRLVDGRFLDPGDADAVAEATLERLDGLGSVQVLESDELWGGMSRFFGVDLEPNRANVTSVEALREGALPISAFDTLEMLDLVDRRCVADRFVYDALLRRHEGGAGVEARRIAAAAFGTQLMRLEGLIRG